MRNLPLANTAIRKCEPRRTTKIARVTLAANSLAIVAREWIEKIKLH
jgi:hypothetical protein